MTSKFSYWKFVAAFTAIIMVVAGGYFIWSKFFKYDVNKAYKEQEEKYIAAMTADTYGGKTPQETLDMFVAALRKGDVELASKYFLLDENASREEWVDKLNSIKNRDLLGAMIKDLKKVSPDPDGVLYEGDFGFVIYTSDNLVGAEIDMEFNGFSKVWKIESF